MQIGCMEQLIAGFVGSKNVAVVGVSRRKFGGAIYRSLKKCGYTVYPVHLTMLSYDGDRCWPNLAELPSEVDSAVSNG